MRDVDALQTTSNLPMTRGKKWRERQRREICTFCFYICESCCGRREHIKGEDRAFYANSRCARMSNVGSGFETDASVAGT